MQIATSFSLKTAAIKRCIRERQCLSCGCCTGHAATKLSSSRCECVWNDGGEVG
jgi:hypothetical protein